MEKGAEGMDSKKCNDRAKSIGVALIRWALGVVFLVAGVSKIFMLRGFVTGYLAPAFQDTFLPAWLVISYGYTLPFVETILGIMLIAGCYRLFSLTAAGLTLITLAFGQMLVQGTGVTANIMLYVLMTAIALFLQEHDRLVWRGCD